MVLDANDQPVEVEGRVKVTRDIWIEVDGGIKVDNIGRASNEAEQTKNKRSCG
jgi:pentose-5-phosphate-3-epimerase